MQAELNTAEGQDRYLMAGLAFAVERQGIIPSARQVLSFKVAPVLGAAIAVENIEVMDFEVIVHITGQLVRAVTAVPAAPSPAGGRRGAGLGRCAAGTALTCPTAHRPSHVPHQQAKFEGAG